MATTLADIHPLIIQTHILPFLDGPSLSSAATASQYLHQLCADENLWSRICNSTWPSITDPRLNHVISTFPAGHRSFFQDSFPALVTDVNHHNPRLDLPSHPFPSQIISAVDIRYKNDTIYSRVEVTDTTTTEFLSSALQIRLNGSESKDPGIFQSIDEHDEMALSHLENSLTLSWILIDPNRRRAGNLSSIKPVSVRKGWMTNETHLLYAIVLPGCDRNKMVQCRIQVVLGAGLQVKEVVLELLDMEFCRLEGRDFLVILQGAISEESNVRRKMVDEEERVRSYREFKRMSIDSLSELQSDNNVVRRSFHLSKVQKHRFVLSVIFVIGSSWLMNLFPLI